MSKSYEKQPKSNWTYIISLKNGLRTTRSHTGTTFNTSFKDVSGFFFSGTSWELEERFKALHIILELQEWPNSWKPTWKYQKMA